MNLPNRNLLAKLNAGQICCSRWKKADSKNLMSDEEVEYELSNSPSGISWIGHIVSFKFNDHKELLVTVNVATTYTKDKVRARTFHFSQIYIIGKA